MRPITRGAEISTRRAAQTVYLRVGTGHGRLNAKGTSHKKQNARTGVCFFEAYVARCWHSFEFTFFHWTFGARSCHHTNKLNRPRSYEAAAKQANRRQKQTVVSRIRAAQKYPPAEPRRPATATSRLKPRRGGDVSRDPHAKKGGLIQGAAFVFKDVFFFLILLLLLLFWGECCRFFPGFKKVQVAQPGARHAQNDQKGAESAADEEDRRGKTRKCDQ